MPKQIRTATIERARRIKEVRELKQRNRIYSGYDPILKFIYLTVPRKHMITNTNMKSTIPEGYYRKMLENLRNEDVWFFRYYKVEKDQYLIK